MIVLSEDVIQRVRQTGQAAHVHFQILDNDVYNGLDQSAERGVDGLVALESHAREAEEELCQFAGRVLVLVGEDWEELPGIGERFSPPVTGYVAPDMGQQQQVKVLPVKGELFSRFKGLLESDLVHDMRVAILGQGSVGSVVSVFLAQSGVDDFFLMDGDRIEVCNVVRHDAGIVDVGRYKTKYVAERIRQKNPYASVTTCEEMITADNQDAVREIIRDCALVVCTVDDREGKLLVNRLCVEERKPCIYAGAFRRAHGGQVLRVLPGESLCYQCFVRMLPEEDVEVSSPEQVAELQYTDRPVPIEPGLAIDIAPINVMTAKLCLQELLRGKDTTLHSLDDDLVADWYLFLNRREVETQYEHLPPLGYATDGFRILRWYGIQSQQDPLCPCCGDFDLLLSAQFGVDAGALEGLSQ